ncbi:Vacuolar proton translocating ATPase 100 kDa subunit (Clathrin-coated vesicle/synaptic vesicle proton pump 100 kDa subunit) (Vacuolar ATPase transmembrane subunit) [Durusdinium trenchii]|uniref:V-type proton ATPase subunit a n=1 Tax=Durusdinium trenchii TaxID=1381693 RepID=A0ABP0ST81_9DINO
MANGEDDGVKGVKEWFRSADMEYVSIVLQEHCAHKVLSQVGRLGAVQFTDLNSELTVFQRRYVREVQRCDAVERKLRYLEEQLDKFKITPHKTPSVDEFLNRVERRNPIQGEDTRGQVNYMNSLEVHVNEKEKELAQLNKLNGVMTADYHSQIELQHVLRQAKEYAQSNGADQSTFDAQSADIGNDGETGAGATAYEESIRFRFIAGVVNQEDRARFERMVFRSTRGNYLAHFADIDEALVDAATGEEVHKEVFIIFFQAPQIENKIKRICEAFGARLYKIPDLSKSNEIEETLERVHEDIQDRGRVLASNKNDITSVLAEVSEYVEVWKWVVVREKAIFHTMNHFAADVTGVLRAEGWVVSSKKEELVTVISKAHESTDGDMSAAMPMSVTTLDAKDWPSSPPTHFKVNKFTEVFQLIVDTYGVPRYQEANPAIMTVITFPFAFGVMFGDIGHGLLLLVFALYIVYNEKRFEKMKNDNDLTMMLFGGRYMLVLMGFFATYAGGIYNDWFAIGLRIWPTTWQINETASTDDTIHYDPDGNVYPFGVDPTWHRAENDLLYFNSVKMKMAVIFGVVQMSVGLIHRMQNAIYFHKGSLFTNIDLWFEAVPMFVFMQSLFGYMCFTIIYKWSLSWTDPDCGRVNCLEAPPLITTLINIALDIGNVEVLLYENQGTVQTILLLIAVIMVPIMLIPKPYILIKRMKKEHGVHSEPSSADPDDHGESDLMLGDDTGSGSHAEDAAVAPAGHDDEEHSSGDIIIHQAIETIEFTLGCISNTASYLRLWALSLAHSQLASVFLEKALLDFITEDGASGVLMTFIGYAVFAAITFAVLMCMDNLECFLHALRLHWVEFQNKFFRGDGVAFTPLNFRASLEEVAAAKN